MGQVKHLSSLDWGTLLSEIVDHDMAKLLSQAEVKTLTETGAETALYRQLRSFMALKSTLKSCQPRSETLRPAHEALLHLSDRLFVAANQALLAASKARTDHIADPDDAMKSQQLASPVPGRLPTTGKVFTAARQILTWGHRTKAAEEQTIFVDLGQQERMAVPSAQFVLEWQLVRLKVARERLIMELADLSERHNRAFCGLNLSDALRAEVESARLSVSNVWEKIHGQTTSDFPTDGPADQ